MIRAFNKEEQEKKDFEQANDSLVKGQIFVGKISALMNPLTYVIIVNGALAVLIWTGAWQVEGRRDHSGPGGGLGQLYVPDPCGTGQACQSDY